MQLHGTLRDAPPSLRLELRATLLFVSPRFGGHRCPVNLDRSVMKATASKIVGPYDAQEGFLGSVAVRWLIDGAEADERVSLVDHARSSATTSSRRGPA